MSSFKLFRLSCFCQLYATLSDDPYAPIFHISPAGCGGGYTRDPNGPFEYRGVHHIFWQYAPPGGPRVMHWGHAAGNLSHWHCLPPALTPGHDSDGTATLYDQKGVFTGSVTVFNNVPVATYPGTSPEFTMCEASPVNLSDPLLTIWKKSHMNPVMSNTQGPKSARDPLGCTSSWQENAGNWTTTIERPYPIAKPGLKTTFWTSADFLNWTLIGTLGCPLCDLCQQRCSDFYRAPDVQSDRWVFGINSHGCGLASGGMVTGSFDRASLKFTPERPEWAALLLAGNASAAKHYAYDYGQGSFPKSYTSADDRRINWAWIPGAPPEKPDVEWDGLQTVPRAVSPAEPDDATTAMLSNPVEEISVLRKERLADAQGLVLDDHGWRQVGDIQTRHFDATVTFRGLSTLRANDLAGVELGVGVLGNAAVTIWRPEVFLKQSADFKSWVAGEVQLQVNSTYSGPLAVRKSRDSLSVRLLVDGSIVECFWDNGRARLTSRFYGNTSMAGLTLSGGNTKGITADVEVWSMGSMWLPGDSVGTKLYEAVRVE